jgi:hypothetical protein
VIAPKQLAVYLPGVRIADGPHGVPFTFSSRT